LLELATQQGTLAEAEKEIILQIISLDHRTAKDVMKPRSRMACVSDDSSVEEMIEAARKFKHRRLPMYDETPDTIVGILNTRALLLDPQIDLADAIEFPSFVPESMNLLQLLKSMQRQQRGMAIVLDEFGGTAGIITLEDIIEELVGEIQDEYDTEAAPIIKHSSTLLYADGDVWPGDANELIDSHLPEEGHDTLAGLIMSTLGRLPHKHETVEIADAHLTVLSKSGNRILRLKVEKIIETSTDDGA